MEIFKPQLFFSHATCLYTRLNEFFLNLVACSILPFIPQGKQCDKCTWRRMSLKCFCEIFINVNKLFIVIFACCLRCPCSVVACLLIYSFSYWCCCCLLTSLSLFYTDVVVVACLLPYLFFILMSLLYFCLFVDHVNTVFRQTLLLRKSQ